MLLSLWWALTPTSEAYGVRCADLGCMECVHAPIDTVRPDSVLSPPDRYGPMLAFDNNPDTAWCEGAPGHGEGNGLTITLKTPQVIEAIRIHGGYFKTAAVLSANSRLQTMMMRASHTASGQHYVVALSFTDPTVPPQSDPCNPGEPADPNTWFAVTRQADGEMVFRNEGGAHQMPIDVIELDISAVYPGAKYTDTCISEIEIITRTPTPE